MGTSIWDKLILAKYNKIPTEKFGANASNINKMFDGMCVNTIVFTSPIFEAIFVASRNETAVKTPAAEKIYDNVVRSAPNLE